ncbi:MAG TPA: hypothetical protein VFO42_08885 [Sphingomicrobium sp.]|nr:hypothetical protein [Sphingomicrobium sp.]
MMRCLAVLLPILLAACGDDGVVADNVGDIPPIELTESPTADWSALEPAIGRTPAHSGMLTKGPIVTDLHALLGADAIDYRNRLERNGGPLTRVGRLLVTASPDGERASYLIVDPDQLALEAGYKKNGQWVVQRTASSDIARPPAIEAMLSR